MIKNFTFGNYRSFKDQQTLLLEKSTGDEADNGNLDVVFGPNASGKTNILLALEYLRFAIQNEDAVSNMTTRHPLLQHFLLNKSSSKEPCLFELTLAESDSTSYRYGFEVNIAENQVSSEWLFETAKRNQKTTERKIFTRDEKGFSFDASTGRHIKSLYQNIPNNVLALKRFANENHPASLTVASGIANKFILFNATNAQQIEPIALKHYAEDPDLLARATKIIHALDFAINKIDVEHKMISKSELANIPLPDQLRPLLDQQQDIFSSSVRTYHNTYSKKGDIIGSVAFDLKGQESQGTQNLLPFLAMVLHAMDNGLIVVIDEFGSGWHPFISAYLTKMFAQCGHKGQFVLLTHETYLLSQKVGLAKNQIWFVEKNRKEESNLTCLSQYKPRDDVRFEKQYLEGRFGAVPSVFEVED